MRVCCGVPGVWAVLEHSWDSLMTAGACIQLLEPGTVRICNTGIPLLCTGCFMLQRKCHDKGNMAADDGYAFPVISN